MAKSTQAPRRRGLFFLYFAAAVALLSAGYIFRSELQAVLGKLEGVIGLLGPAAPLGLAVICGLWGALCLPGPLMQGTVGTLFATRPLVALAVVVAGETIAQMIAFALARHVGRERVRHKLEDKPWFNRLEQETARRGVYGVFLFRLMPFCPNALGSYAFGLTGLSFWPYLIASAVGSFPKMVVYIYGTTSLVKLVQSGAATPRNMALACAALLLVTLLARAFQKWLQARARVSGSALEESASQD